ncbi:MAG TPA: SRPBCC family protein [Kofleriaceae bacterium]|nr:SRPBCC family protein [Kofleriaceae bacterium]
MTTTNTDEIRKVVTLRAPRSRVWRAISDAREFSAWFGVELEGAFEAGKTIRGRIRSPGYEHVVLEAQVERIEPERYFAYRWHPYAIQAGVDYSSEPTTLVEFSLEDAGPDTVLTIVESGFDRIPAARRAEAFRMNEGGWTQQAKNLATHVES